MGRGPFVSPFAESSSWAGYRAELVQPKQKEIINRKQTKFFTLFVYLLSARVFASVGVCDSCGGGGGGGEGSGRDEGSAAMGKQKGRASSSGMAASLVPHAQGAVPTVGFGGYHGAVRVEPAAPSDPDAPIRLTPVWPLSLCLSLLSLSLVSHH